MMPTATAVATGRASPAATIAGAGAIALAVAMGIGRFAFTPLLPFMLRDGTIDLSTGSALATANYIGYLAGALACMALPRRWPPTRLLRLGLVATVVLTFAMVAEQPAIWLVVRFLTGVVSALVFVLTAGWALERLAERGRASLGGLIFTGPGAGIALSGFVAMGLTGLHWSGHAGWIAFGVLALLLTLLIWPVLGVHQVQATPQAGAGPAPAPGRPESKAELAVFALAYCLEGFGYIITATFLPVIAGAALPGSPWLALFWPVFGLAAVAGCLLAIRTPVRHDRRLLLVLAYLCQAVGVVFALIVPNVTGFTVGSLLVGLPFTAITFWAMQEARRLRPRHAARAMGLLTALYGLGQIAGPPVVAWLLALAGSRPLGFALSLSAASGTLVAGAVLYVLMARRWPAP
ncbi:MAG: YbfB/YjiJ family MFS transporter [Janthinobacterium lividum]